MLYIDKLLPCLNCVAIIIGFERSNYTVNESIGTQEVRVRILVPPDDQPFSAEIALVVQTIVGSRSKDACIKKLVVFCVKTYHPSFQ